MVSFDKKERFGWFLASLLTKKVDVYYDRTTLHDALHDAKESQENRTRMFESEGG